MASKSFDTVELSQLLVNVVAILILASMSMSLLAFAPWEIDPLFSPLSHFLTLWPLLLLAIITYIAKVKLTDEEQEVP